MDGYMTGQKTRSIYRAKPEAGATIRKIIPLKTLLKELPGYCTILVRP